MNNTLTLQDLFAISPLLILLFGSLAVLIVESFFGNTIKKTLPYITVLTFIAALGAVFYQPISHNPLLTNWIRYDDLSYFFDVLFLLIAISCTFLASAFFKKYNASFHTSHENSHGNSHGEYYFLLISSVLGLLLIGKAADFLTIFIGIETLSISLYILCGYMKEWKLSHESALKYFFMGALATAFFIYGIALIYGATGTTELKVLLSAYQNIQDHSTKMLFIIGAAFITIGLSFKAALVPFHTWAPDVYDGAPTPVTAFMATGTKVGALAAFAVIFLLALPNFDMLWNAALSVLVYATLIYANFVALKQIHLRRFFAYSGISHAGFLLIPVVAGMPDSISALTFYLVVYVFATLGAFAVLQSIEERKEGVFLSDLYGLYYKSPFAAVVLSICLLTLAGIPPTAGFFAKLYVFKTAFEAHYYGLVIVGLLTTILAAFYYLRMIAVMFSERTSEAPILHKTAKSPLWQATFVGTVALCAIIFLSLYPDPLLNLLASLK